MSAGLAVADRFSIVCYFLPLPWVAETLRPTARRASSVISHHHLATSGESAGKSNDEDISMLCRCPLRQTLCGILLEGRKNPNKSPLFSEFPAPENFP
ncbi:MAG: hypothetical protein HY231_18425 [Acidobacteria bacterium]|nr:hypothetical protein [Acidobacteriota bacterium]